MTDAEREALDLSSPEYIILIATYMVCALSINLGCRPYYKNWQTLRLTTSSPLVPSGKSIASTRACIPSRMAARKRWGRTVLRKRLPNGINGM
ncbi:hypothetical protein EJ03DRAFT_129232 [Teratosphaeria nubilosa]|uniref:Uncharacterized protein n=1 Tax=Teratosphaeria nubilosa TaxID=161662 RepID=A0A6G1LK37_9PEZI|nr:hypothetical protein EJ03DRAFT_129232 [Teratosphaeria nubilosa]